jgi:hypothetical protein
MQTVTITRNHSLRLFHLQALAQAIDAGLFFQAYPLLIAMQPHQLIQHKQRGLPPIAATVVLITIAVAQKKSNTMSTPVRGAQQDAQRQSHPS